MKDTALIVVDMLYDFIDGSLACKNADNAVAQTVKMIDRFTADSKGDEAEILGLYPILFVRDHHPADHCSFKENGGSWPSHCVASTHGGEIHKDLQPYVEEELVFSKGCNPSHEQYSGFEALNEAGQSVDEILSLMDIHSIVVCGIATEYCVRNTCEDFLKAGYKVILAENCLGWVDDANHRKAIKEMAAEGIQMM